MWSIGGKTALGRVADLRLSTHVRRERLDARLTVNQVPSGMPGSKPGTYTAR
jgi:hypothetical protein